MHRIKTSFVLDIERLINQYIYLIEESNRLQKKNPKKAMLTLIKASLLEVKIEELKIAYKN